MHAAAARGRVRAILAVVCLVAALGACSQSGEPQHEVSLLPSATANAQSWDWTARCPIGPQGPAGCATAGPELGSSQLAGNEWNLGSGAATGESVTMSVNAAGALKVGANITSAPPCTAVNCLATQANTWVRGFPSVLYGIDQCHATTSPGQSPELPLPQPVDAIASDLIGRSSYDAQGGQVTYDVAYDLWLSASDTRTPCQTDGTIEVMVWTDYNAQALLPAALKVATATIPLDVNGVSTDRTWSVYASNVYRAGHTAPWGGTVWLVPDPADATQQGTVTVDLSAALAAAGKLLEHNYGWASFSHNYWLDTVAFGMEYGPQDADPYGDGPASFSLDISSYCLALRTTVGKATC